MVRVHERGSVVGYIVVGIVLAAVVVGGVYLVKHQLQGQLAGKSNTADVATTAKSTPAPDSQKPDTSSNTDNKNSDNKAATSDKNTSVTPGSTDQNQSSSTSAAPAPSTSNTSSSATTGSNLPKTGPASVIGTAAILAMLFGAYTAYRRSLKV